MVKNRKIFINSDKTIKTLFICVITIAIISNIACSFIMAFNYKSPRKTVTFVLDAGHGGVDNGVVSKSGIRESDLNLEYTLLLKDKLSNIGFKVILTRQNKDGLYTNLESGFKREDMRKRREIIASSGADIVISIHMNKFSDTSRKGAQVFYQKGDQISQPLASCIQKTLNAFLDSTHSHLSGDYYILQCLPNCPSVIVECGFLSNPDEAQLLASCEYKKQLVDYIFQGIILYLTSI